MINKIIDGVPENNDEKEKSFAMNVGSGSLYIVKNNTASPYTQSVPGESTAIIDATDQFNRGVDILKQELIFALDNAKGAFLGAMISFVAMELCGSFLTGNTGQGYIRKGVRNLLLSEMTDVGISDFQIDIRKSDIIKEYELHD